MRLTFGPFTGSVGVPPATGIFPHRTIYIDKEYGLCL
jgi:hypothetical protein